MDEEEQRSWAEREEKGEPINIEKIKVDLAGNAPGVRSIFTLLGRRAKFTDEQMQAANTWRAIQYLGHGPVTDEDREVLRRSSQLVHDAINRIGNYIPDHFRENPDDYKTLRDFGDACAILSGVDWETGRPIEGRGR